MVPPIPFLCVLLLLALTPQAGDEVLPRALASLRADSLALDDLGVKSLVGIPVVLRTYQYAGWQSALQPLAERISRSTRCAWHGWPVRDVLAQLQAAAAADSSSHHGQETLTGYAIAVGPNGKETPRQPLDTLVAFASPSFRGMSVLTFFRAWSDREAMGGAFGQYASFNSGVQYLACRDSTGLEVIGPIRWAYD